MKTAHVKLYTGLESADFFLLYPPFKTLITVQGTKLSKRHALRCWRRDCFKNRQQGRQPAAVHETNTSMDDDSRKGKGRSQHSNPKGRGRK